jgi:hypothetical protein
MATHSVTLNRFSLPSVSRYYARRREGRPAGELASRLGEARDSEDRALAPGTDEGDGGE